MGRKSNGTHGRILEASLLLFNEQGERAISTNHIAAHLGISPGNLYYHFANKDEIIFCLFSRYREELLGYLENTALPETVGETVGYMAGIYDILWEYRFLFSDVNTLMTRNSAFSDEHSQFSRRQFAPLAARLLATLRGKGIIDSDDTGVQNLTVNMWLVTKYWFDFDGSLNGRDSAKAQAVKARGVQRTLSLVRPHLKPQHVPAFDSLMQTLDAEAA